MKIRFAGIIAALFICFGLGAETAGQTPDKSHEFNWRGKIAAGGIVEIMGVKGNIQAETSAGSEVEVVALKQGNQDEFPQVAVRVVESEGKVRICAAYPNLEGIGDPQCLESLEWDSQIWNGNRELRLRYNDGKKQSVRLLDVKVQFKVRIPVGVRFSARTISGDITASFGIADISRPIELESLGGNVSLEVPKAFNAHVRLSAGEVESDFPVTVMGRFPGNGLEGSIGQGGPKISLSGSNVVIRRAK
jgi:hypothetical protein